MTDTEMRDKSEREGRDSKYTRMQMVPGYAATLGKLAIFNESLSH